MNIIVADKMETEVIELLREIGTVNYQPQDLGGSLIEADILIVRSATKVTAKLISNATNLKIVARAGVGLDNVDLEACQERGIKVINTPGASAKAVSELVIGLMIGCLRNIQKAHFEMKNGKWNKKKLIGQEISGKTLGILGYGRIGSMVAQKAKALGMEPVAYDPHAKNTEGVKMIGDLDEFLSISDVITIHAPLVESTRSLINSENIAKMKDGVCIINTARGEIIDEDALHKACKEGKVGSAALDVYCNEPYAGPLLELDNVYFTPHLGASTKEAQIRIGEELVGKIKKEMGN